jgi:hypothetical protein
MVRFCDATPAEGARERQQLPRRHCSTSTRAQYSSYSILTILPTVLILLRQHVQPTATERTRSNVNNTKNRRETQDDIPTTKRHYLFDTVSSPLMPGSGDGAHDPECKPLDVSKPYCTATAPHSPNQSTSGSALPWAHHNDLLSFVWHTSYTQLLSICQGRAYSSRFWGGLGRGGTTTRMDIDV